MSPTLTNGGEVKHVGSRIIAWRSDGTSARIQTFRRSDGGYTEHEVKDIDGTFVLKEARAKSTIYLSSVAAVHRVLNTKYDPKANCTVDRAGKTPHGSFYPGLEKINSYDAVRFNGGTFLKVWYAPSLDCEMVGHVAEFRDQDGKLADINQLRLTRVLHGEPDPQLFAVGSDYVEVTPDELYGRDFTRRGLAPPADLRTSLKPLIDAYNKRRNL